MEPNQVVKKLKSSCREVSATAVAATKAKEEAFKKQTKSFVLKEPVEAFSAASCSAVRDPQPTRGESELICEL